jgi:hypothetical protein
MTVLNISLAFFISILPLFPVFSQTCQTGKEGNIWYFGGYFGDPAGLDFNAGSPPVPINGCAIPVNQGYESYAVVSDAEGELLFYSNGKNVWNRNHQLMSNNGFGVGGHPSATQIIAVPKPGSETIYYLFTPEAAEAHPLTQDTVRRMYYATIDMALDNGLGAITEKNKILFQSTTEKAAATRHCNGQDWWVLTHEAGSNRFFAWLLNSNGINSQPVVSSAGKGNLGITYFYNLGLNGISASVGGGLKISPNGNYIAMAEAAQASLNMLTYDGHIEVFRFNNQTGEVSDPILLQDSLRSAYGVEFSPDNSKVYFKVWDPQERVLQYDLSVWHPDSIRQSKYAVADVGVTTNYGGMALGPDGKIYLANANYGGIPQKSLDVIHRPNARGAACDYRGGAQGLLLPDSVGVGLGLPNFPAAYYAPAKPWLAGPRQACPGAVQRYYVTGNCAAVDYTWEASGGSIVQQQGDSVWVRFEAPGEQSVVVQRQTACAVWSDTLRVAVSQSLSLTVTATPAGCGGSPNGTASVTVSGGAAGYTYQWNDPAGQTTPVATGLSTQTYTVTVTDALGCTAGAAVEVPGGDLSLGITISPIRCHDTHDGTAAITPLNGTPPFVWHWQGGQTDSLLTGLGSGTYAVTVTDAQGCSDHLTFSIEAPLPLVPEVSAADALCFDSDDGTASVLVSGGTPDYQYWWSNFAVTASVEGLSPGWYGVTVSDENQCEDTAGVWVGAPLPVVILSDSIRPASGNATADGAIFTGTITGGMAPYFFEWSTGDTTQNLEGILPGEYSLTVTDAYNCIAIFSYAVDLEVGMNSRADNKFRASILPNPGAREASSFLLAENTGMPRLVELALYDALGQLLFHEKRLLANGKTIHDLPPLMVGGTYLLLLKGEHGDPVSLRWIVR